jgi:rhamnopyranosyl-N-acetylglucosaminyl-diphospho-decaprenol beta-1,3/1,4-galactofuranosyltransferase
VPESIHAVVVTFNRKHMLRECLDALRAQSRPPDRVLVVDNASTDGTLEMVRSDHPDVDLLALPYNQGGAGGFHEGLARAYRDGADWAWLMDDDTIASRDALAELIGAPDRLSGAPRPLLLASKAVWDDGRVHPMNIPQFEREALDHVVLAAENGVLPMRAATFVSLLVKREAIERYGLPLKHFFIWSDDVEYTARILRHEAGYAVPQSVVHHKTKTAHTAVSSAGDRFYYHVRNMLYMIRGDAWATREKVFLAWVVASTSIEYLRRNSFSPHAVRLLLRGIRDGLRPVR